MFNSSKKNKELIMPDFRHNIVDLSDFFFHFTSECKDWEKWKKLVPLDDDGLLLHKNYGRVPLSVPHEQQKQYVRLRMYFQDVLGQMANEASQATIDFNKAKAAKDDDAADEMKMDFQDMLKHYACLLESLIANLDDQEIQAIRNVSDALKQFFDQERKYYDVQ